MNNNITKFEELNSDNILTFFENYEIFLTHILQFDTDFPFTQDPTIEKFNKWLEYHNENVTNEDESIIFSDNEKAIFLQLFITNREIIEYNYWDGGEDTTSYIIWMLPMFNKNVHIEGDYDPAYGTEYEFSTTQLKSKQITIWEE